MKVVVLSFNSIHDALETQHLLEETSLFSNTIPTPTTISSECGISLMIKQADFHHIEDLQVQLHFSAHSGQFLSGKLHLD